MDGVLVMMAPGLLLFWAAWHSLVLLTNSFELAKVMGRLRRDFPFASQNFELIARATAVYRIGAGTNLALFVAVVAWQALTAVLLWLGAGAVLLGQAGTAVLLAGPAASAALWAGFMLADELFRAYEQQVTHLLLLVAQLATVLVILAA